MSMVGTMSVSHKLMQYESHIHKHVCRCVQYVIISLSNI